MSVPSVEWPSSIVNSANGMDGMFDVRFFGERDLTRLKFVSSTPGVKLEYFIGESASWVGGTCRSVQVRATFPNSLDTDTTTDISIHLFAATRELGSTAEMLIGSKLIQFRKKYAYALIPKNVFLRKKGS